MRRRGDISPTPPNRKDMSSRPLQGLCTRARYAGISRKENKQRAGLFRDALSGIRLPRGALGGRERQDVTVRREAPASGGWAVILHWSTRLLGRENLGRLTLWSSLPDKIQWTFLCAMGTELERCRGRSARGPAIDTHGPRLGLLVLVPSLTH